jgi:methyltransferase (TIGR00027 family)
VREVEGRKTTAEMAAFARAAGALDSAARNPDTLAARFLSPRFKVGLLPGIRHALHRGYEWLCPGLYMFIQARTHHVDAVVASRHAQGLLDQLVILGAGLDTRAYRLPAELATTRVFEVDFPATARWKRALLERARTKLDHVRYVEIDFTKETLAARLPAAGFDPTKPTLFLWEGVTMYLPESAVVETLSFVGGTTRSAIVFDYFYRRAFEAPEEFHGAKETLAFCKRRGEPCLFGVDADVLGDFVRRCGLRLTANDGPRELGRLVTLGPGRSLVDFAAMAVCESVSSSRDPS